MPKAGEEVNLDDKILRSVGFGYENNCKNSSMRVCLDFNSIIDYLATDNSSTLSYVDLVQINKTKCNKHTEEIYVIYPGNTACLYSSNSTKGFCYVSYLRSKMYQEEILLFACYVEAFLQFCMLVLRYLRFKTSLFAG
jgi:hypothetical protein